MKLKLLPIAAAALITFGCATAPTPTPAPSNPPGGQAGPGDLGAGTPGAGCATNRLGKRFTQNGYVYVCKGPKPYQWRRADAGSTVGEAGGAAAVQVGRQLP